MATGFDESNWSRHGPSSISAASMKRTDSAFPFGFEPLVGRALQVTIPAGEHLGLDLGYQFAKEIGTQPEEIFFATTCAWRMTGNPRPTAATCRA